MKITRSLTLILTGLLVLASGRSLAQTEEDAIAEARALIKADREVVVDKGLQLTESESQAFWPLYDRYRAEMDKVNDGVVKLMKEYAECYPDVPDDRARAMLKDLTKLEKAKVATRATYLKRFGKILPPAKNLRFAQIENRLDLAVQLKVASRDPTGSD